MAIEVDSKDRPAVRKDLRGHHRLGELARQAAGAICTRVGCVGSWDMEVLDLASSLDGGNPGLAEVRGMVELLGGRIELDAEVDVAAVGLNIEFLERDSLAR
jgi:hypothetical protein